MSGLVRRLAARLAPRVRPRGTVVMSGTFAWVGRRRVSGGITEVSGDVQRDSEGLREARSPAPSPPPAPAPTGRWQGACPAVSYFTGKRCRLLSGHEGPHCDERREAFERALRPGEQPPYWHRIDSFANRRNHEEVP